MNKISREGIIGNQVSDNYFAGSDSYEITFDEQTDTYRVSVQSNERIPIGVIIVQAIATLTQNNPLKLPPLIETIDPDHLQGVIDATPSRTSSPPTVSFSYMGYEVTVESPTEVRISP